jgi:DNA end-binding protein Ku
LRYPYEARDPQEYFDEIQHVKVTKDMLDLARHIVNQKAGSFEPEKFEDHYENALVDLINQKRAGKPITPKERRRRDNVALMDALRKSVGGAASEASAPKKPAKKSKRAAAGQKEMLMPIDGKKPTKDAAAKKAKAQRQIGLSLGRTLRAGVPGGSSRSRTAAAASSGQAPGGGSRRAMRRACSRA